MYCYEHPMQSVVVDLIVVCERHNGYSYVLVVERGNDPYKGCLALPGGFVNNDETTLEAAKRELFEETGLKDLPEPELFTVADKVDRDPRGRIISVVYKVIVKEKLPIQAGDDAANVKWVVLDNWMFDDDKYAFDHEEILSKFIDSHSWLVEQCGLCNRVNCYRCPRR